MIHTTCVLLIDRYGSIPSRGASIPRKNLNDSPSRKYGSQGGPYDEMVATYHKNGTLKNSVQKRIFLYPYSSLRSRIFDDVRRSENSQYV